MVFEMSLRQDPFSSIQKGTKTVELRLYDEKRARLNIGDYIVFTNLADTTRLAVQITALYRFASFKDLFSDIDLRSCGFDAPLTACDAAKVMEKYYSREEISVYGVLGIRIVEEFRRCP